ncbi:hypothetical protein RHSIM_Rhsim10G0000200 [Rhododendron simsii]|uniref:Uncharacterized protein n=1 Tax=Rhododendron simsii TaxID=118357 RepID=A0A834LDS9_RHOSS|nr:hypothetical protein RHSIM_Rhsim10G0000200 [Rhododendron simsii]
MAKQAQDVQEQVKQKLAETNAKYKRAADKRMQGCARVDPRAFVLIFLTKLFVVVLGLDFHHDPLSSPQGGVGSTRLGWIEWVEEAETLPSRVKADFHFGPPGHDTLESGNTSHVDRELKDIWRRSLISACSSLEGSDQPSSDGLGSDEDVLLSMLGWAAHRVRTVDTVTPAMPPSDS